MRPSTLFALIALLLSSPWATAAQDYEPRHGSWAGVGLGFGPASFACDRCDYRRATASNSSRLGGWAFSLSGGGTPSPRLRVGAEYSGWYHALRKDSLPEVDLLSLLVAMYAREHGGPFLELGAGFSSYALVRGSPDPIEPGRKIANAFVSGEGLALKLGVGWEFPSEFTPRITYPTGREYSLDAGAGTIARGWRHKVLLIEVGGRGP